MEWQDNLSKMRTEYTSPVKYFLKLGEDEVLMNSLIDQEIRIQFTGTINCVACGRNIKKAFGQGFCYPCFMKSPLNSECIIRPELCLAHEGKGRDPEWEKEHHDQPHIVYIALTSAIKVGVTRTDQIPTRWIDQGAWKAIKFARTPFRQIAGLIESDLKNHLSDKTNWQKMLKNEMDHSVDLVAEKIRISELMPPEFKEYFLPADNEILTFEYPVLAYPDKIKSINLDNEPSFHGQLIGMRGQYLIFSDNRVINLRKYSGYQIRLSV
jgi:hypothetical protein